MSGTIVDTRTPWLEPQQIESAATLERNEKTQVCVIGGGIAGLTTAYLLAASGRDVVLLDARNHTGCGETRHTTAHLACVIDDRFVEIERIRGQEVSRLAAQSHAAAIDQIETIARAENINCGFRRLDGYLFLAPGMDPELLEREAEAAHRAGLRPEHLPRAPFLGFDTGRCLCFPRQGQIEPGRYIAGLRRAVQGRGVRVYGSTQVVGVEGGKSPLVRTESGREVSAAAVIVASNTPIHTTVAPHTKQSAYTTYAIGARIPPGSVPLALYWDTADPYHYLRIIPAAEWNDPTGGDLLIVGGADHKTGQEDYPARRWEDLEMWTRFRFRDLGEVSYHWSGQVMETVDGLAFIGPDPSGNENVYIATGDSGMGMTHGTIAGMLLTDQIRGKDNPWAAVYNPARTPVKAAGEFVKEQLNVVAQYADWVTGGDLSSREEIKPGSGAVIRRGLRKLAVYREEDGTTHACSAVCPHLGCIVHWNDAEKTWDCPCHGSRFAARGNVLHGPATSDLTPE